MGGSGLEVELRMFEAVASDEIAFAMTLFVSSANRLLGSSLEEKTETWDQDRKEGERTFLTLATVPLDEAQRSTLLRSALYRCFLAMWDQYAGDERRTSICARVLGFCCLMEKTRGAVVEDWIFPSPHGPEQILLHPAVVEAVATTLLSNRGHMSELALAADIRRLAQNADGSPSGPESSPA